VVTNRNKNISFLLPKSSINNSIARDRKKAVNEIKGAEEENN
jgi:hypothetical protein